MTKIFCPKCGQASLADAEFIGRSKPYCLSCSWNIPVVIATLRDRRKQTLWAILIFTAFFSLFSFFSGSVLGLFPLLFVGGILAVFGIHTQKKIKILEAYTQPVLQPNPPKLSSDSSVSLFPDAAFERLRFLSKPRAVRFKTVPKIISFAFPILFILLTVTLFLHLQTNPLASSLFNHIPGTIIVFGFCIFILAQAQKHRRLLAEGDLAIATIISQSFQGRNQRSAITYEFTDASGRRIQSGATDNSRTLFEEMRVAVFYNPDNPFENIPLPAAECELAEA
jgi:hypothetical protein